MSMHKGNRKKKKEKTRRSDININDALWKERKSRGGSKIIHIWPGSLAIVALLPLAMTCTCTREHKKENSDTQGQRWGMLLVLVAVLLCSVLSVRPFAAHAASPILSLLLLLIHAIRVSAFLKVADWKDW